VSDTPDITAEDIAHALRALATSAFTLHREAGMFESENVDEEDVASFFAQLHGRVASAFASWDVGVPLTQISYIDEDGEEVPEGAGSPSGMPIDMIEIVLDVLAACRLMKIDVGKAVAEAMRGRQEDAKGESANRNGELT
jgi:hypothetical protein